MYISSLTPVSVVVKQSYPIGIYCMKASLSRSTAFRVFTTARTLILSGRSIWATSKIIVGSEFQIMTSFCGGRTLRLHATLFGLGQRVKPSTTLTCTGWSRNNRLCAHNFGKTRFISSTAVPSVTKTWVDCLPPRVQPYAYLSRIDKPIGTLLLFYPCGSSISSLAGITLKTY